MITKPIPKLLALAGLTLCLALPALGREEEQNYSALAPAAMPPRIAPITQLVCEAAQKSPQISLDALYARVQESVAGGAYPLARHIRQYPDRFTIECDGFDVEIFETGLSRRALFCLPNNPGIGMAWTCYDQEDLLGRIEAMLLARKGKTLPKPTVQEKNSVARHALQLKISDKDIPMLGELLLRRPGAPQIRKKYIEMFLRDLLLPATLGKKLRHVVQEAVPAQARARVEAFLELTGAADSEPKKAFWMRYLDYVSRNGGVNVQRTQYLGEFIGYFFGKDEKFHAEAVLGALREHCRALGHRAAEFPTAQKLVQELKGFLQEEADDPREHGLNVFRRWLLTSASKTGTPVPLLKITREGQAWRMRCLEGNVEGKTVQVLRDLLRERTDLPDEFMLEIIPGRPAEWFAHDKPDTLTLPQMAFEAAGMMGQEELSLLPAWKAAAQRAVSLRNPETMMESLAMIPYQLLHACLDHELGHYYRRDEAEIHEVRRQTYVDWPPLQKAYWLWFLQCAKAEGIRVPAE